MRMFREFIVMMSAVAGCACTAVPAMADEVAESRTEGTAGDGMECVGWAHRAPPWSGDVDSGADGLACQGA